jgi:molybdopterin synthase catalytic subunit
VRVQVLFFGLLRDITGRSDDVLEMAEGSRLQDLFDHYARQYPRLSGLASSIVLARNQAFETPEALMADGDEIAFLPPVSGGKTFTHVVEDEAGHFFALTREKIDTEALKERMLANHDGAICVFEGVVRDNTKGRKTRFLDYECYEAMAVKLMAQIGREIAAKHEVSRVAMVHRLGRLQVREASVVVVVTSPHRVASFEACLEGINRLKKTVPVWKKEYFEDGEVWVEGDWDDNVVTRVGG